MRKSVTDSSKKLMRKWLKIDSKEAILTQGDVDEEELNEGTEGEGTRSWFWRND